VVPLTVAAILLVAAFAQTATGFGFALLAVPLMTLVTDPRTAVVVMALAALLQTGVTTAREHGAVRWSDTRWLLAACLVGLPIGVVVLRAAPARVLTALIAVCALGGVVVVWRDLRLARPGRLAMALAGLVTGVLTTSTGTNGPPLVAAFHAMGYPPRTLRATVAAVFLVTGVVSVAAFAVAGLVTAQVGRYALAGLPAVLLGWRLGETIFVRIDAARFRTVLLAALVVSAVVTLGRAVLHG